MSRELYINGARVDIDRETAINQQYKSPIFSDLQKLIANTTLTIKLPLTAHNRSLINNINVIGVQNQFPQDYFRVDYVVDGFTQIENGIGYMLGISDSLEVSVIFGGSTRLSKIKDVKLNEMPIPVAEGQISWGLYNQWAEIGNTNGVLFPYADYGLGAAENYQVTEHTHPSVRVSQVIKWINQAYDLNIGPIGEDMSVVCVTRNRHTPAIAATFLSRNTKPYGISNCILLNNPIGPASWDFIVKLGHPGSDDSDDLHCLASGQYRLDAHRNSNGSTIPIDVIGFRDEIEETQWWHRNGDNDQCDVYLKKNTFYKFYVSFTGSMEPNIDVRFSIVPIDKEILDCEKFDTIHNLPPIKIVDFLKAVMQIHGVFPRLSGTQIDYVSVDDLYNQLHKAKDWSDKLLEVKNRSFQFLDFAQDNTVSWVEDDTAPDQYIGSLKVANKTIAAKGEAIKLPFAAIKDDGQATAIIPLYSNKAKEGEEPEIEMENLKPRIVRLTNRFDGKIHASSISSIEIMDRYNKYQQVILTPKVVKCTMRLQPRDIAELDLSVPVYVEQFSNHFAVMNITTRGEMSDVEMLML